ncbi:unnamed protein product [Porites evermanni]|uniref:Nicotinamide-nucleotide adenylyltransferase n=1 Tax=Porites evermanni TaxID=104178 RepID=A0ABN8S0R0_9CNID|nr:unnamed protein product [Porites evermanni]
MAGASSKTRVVLLSCGSFNPITFLHLRMFELARDALHTTGIYSVIRGFISPVNDGYKKKDLIKSEHRVQMCKLGVGTSDWISVHDWESKQPGWLETVKVLTHITDEVQNDFPGFNNIINMERAKKIIFTACHLGKLKQAFTSPDVISTSPKSIEKIVGKHGLVVISRAGSNPESFIYESDVLTKFKNNIHIVTEWIANDVSATKIRRSLRRGESVKYLIPDEVIDYIKANNLYPSTK